MHLYMFKSKSRAQLRAFAGDQTGSKLPEKHGPWQPAGVVRPHRTPPHRLSRDAIEKAIDAQGFQLWRIKPPSEA